MPDPWHEINDPGMFFKPVPLDKTDVAGKDDPDEGSKDDSSSVEVRLSEAVTGCIDGIWDGGFDGVENNGGDTGGEN